MHIRSATEEDVSAILPIHVESWRSAYRGILPDDFLDNRVAAELGKAWEGVKIRTGDVVLLAEQTGLAVGFIAVWCRPDPYVENLHVLPDHRSNGIGMALLVQAARRLRDLGHGTVNLWVFERNLRAVEFYRRLGGSVGDRETRSVFGNAVSGVDVRWDDIAPLCEL